MTGIDWVTVSLSTGDRIKAHKDNLFFGYDKTNSTNFTSLRVNFDFFDLSLSVKITCLCQKKYLLLGI